jgi:hypothetical protein
VKESAARVFESEKRTALYIRAVQVLGDLVRQGGTDLANRAFAEATWSHYKQEFIERYGVQASQDHACIGRLIGESYQSTLTCHLPGADDHASLWIRNGQPFAYVAQPYGISLSDMSQLVTFCEANGLEARIDASLAWHFPGRVLLVDVRKKGQTDAWEPVNGRETT